MAQFNFFNVMNMKVNLKFVKNTVLAGALFFLFGAGFATAQTPVKVTLLDNTEQNYTVESTGKIWFSGSNLVINTDNTLTPTTIPLSNIRKITFDGSGNTSGVKEVTKNKETISIFPNPTNDYFDIEAEGASSLSVYIYNTKGSQVAKGIYKSGERVNVSNLIPGIYVVVINNQSFKLIKI